MRHSLGRPSRSDFVQWGFTDNKAHSINAKVARKEDGWMIRLRDDCVKFNPVKYMEEQEDSVEHVGIKMIAKRAKDISHMNTLNMNNLIIKV